jgi:ATP-binding cassette subfamily B protein RaxB
MTAAIEWPWNRRLRPVLQSEAAECGLAALVMVAQHHGHRVNLAGLRQRFPTSIKGMTLQHLVAIAAELELAPRPVRLEVDELSQLQLPAILHWDLNHFVVLESVSGSKAIVLDPAGGRKVMPLEAVSRHFTGVALELSPTSAFHPVEARPRTRLSDLWSRITNFRGAFAQLLLLSLMLQMLALIAPFFIQLVVDEAIGQGESGLLLLLLVGFGLVYALQGIIRALRDWVSLTFGQSLSFQLAGNVVRHLLRLPVGYFERRHVGDLLSRVGSIQPIQSLLSTGLVSLIIDAGLLVTTIIVMLLVSPLLTAIVVAFTLLYLAINVAMYPGIRRRAEEEILARAQEETHLMESMRAIRAIKLHAHEPAREAAWRNLYADVISATYRSRIFGIQINLAEDLLFGLSFLLTVYFGALAVMSEQLTVGLLIAFLAYRSSFTNSAIALIDQLQSWRLLGLHLERLSDIVTQQKEDVRGATPRVLMSGPEIRLEGLSFTYSPAEPPTFDKLNVTIPAGSFVAIVGPSGAGKTTLMRVLLGLLPPSAGKVVIDGVPLGAHTLSTWRGRIAAVMQDDYLLSGTLADNISFFDPGATDRQVEQFAKLARIHDDIAKMPMAYQSLVSDMGAALSSGQRQRVLLARALYRDPDALFLDEGTANLDEATEAAIAEMIVSLPITRIVIAHRPALVERADIVLRLDEKGLTEVPRDRGVPRLRPRPELIR